jgi:hypothetical protein
MRRIEDTLRSGEHLEELIVLLRGGPDTGEKITRHADRLAQRFTYQGNPARGISLWAARGDLGARAVLAARLSNYRKYYRVSGPVLAALGVLLPTFESPHWTVLLQAPEGTRPRPPDELVSDLLATLGPALDNPRYVPSHGRRR